MIDIKVPSVGESISEVTLLKWVKKEGSYVERDEVIAELESEKATFEVNAEQAGALKQLANEGDTIAIGSLLAQIDETAAKPAASEKKEVSSEKIEDKKSTAVAKPVTGNQQQATSQAPVTAVSNDVKASPVASAIIADKKVDVNKIEASGFGGKILKNDVLDALANPGKKAFAGAELFSRNVRNEK